MLGSVNFSSYFDLNLTKITFEASLFLIAVGGLLQGCESQPTTMINATRQSQLSNPATNGAPTSSTSSSLPSSVSSTSSSSVAAGWIDRCAPLHATYATPVIPGPALRTLYVDSINGNDSNTGLSPQQAWATLTKTNASVKAGDWVLLSGIFTDQTIAPKVSGTAKDRIVYMTSPGQTASLVITTGGITAIHLGSKSYVVIDGIQIQQKGGGDGIYMSGSNFNWIRNITLQANGNSRLFTSSDNRIEDSVISVNANNIWYAQDGISRNIFARNQFSGGNGISFGMGNLTGGASMGNVFFANDFVNHDGPAASIAGNVQNTLFLCNTVRESGLNGTMSYQNGNPSQPQGGGGPALLISASGTVVQFNSFYNNKWEILRMQAVGNCQAGSAVMDVNNNLIQHNLFYDNGGPGIRIVNSGPSSSGCNGNIPNYADIRANRIENNLYWKNSQFCDFHYCNVGSNTIFSVTIDFYHTGLNSWPSGAAGLNANLIRNNFMGRDNSKIGTLWMNWEGYTTPGSKDYTLSAAEKTFAGEISGNSESDPLMTDPDNQNFLLQFSSLGIDFGAVINGLTYQGTAPDIGRYEHQ